MLLRPVLKIALKQFKRESKRSTDIAILTHYNVLIAFEL